MKRRLYVDSVKHHHHGEGSNILPSTDPCIFEVEAVIQRPDARPDRIRAAAQEGGQIPRDTRGSILTVMVAMPPGVIVSGSREAIALGQIAASWVRGEIAKRGVWAFDCDNAARVDRIEVPIGGLHLHPDDPGDGALEIHEG